MKFKEYTLEEISNSFDSKSECYLYNDTRPDVLHKGFRITSTHSLYYLEISNETTQSKYPIGLEDYLLLERMIEKSRIKSHFVISDIKILLRNKKLSKI